MRIILTGGGTGGHLIPLIVVARKIREKVPNVDLIFMGPKGELEKKLLSQENIPIVRVFSGKVRRYFSLLNVLDFFKVIIGIIQCLWLLLFYMPDAIFSKGGYASFPVVLIGWLYRIPVLVHESDSIPGKANQILSKFAKRVAISYPNARQFFLSSQVALTGNPIRENINQGNPAKARSIFSLTEGKKLIFIYGGSQGAREINNKILNLVPKLIVNYDIIHQTGEKNIKEVEKKAADLGIKAGYHGYYPIAFIGEELADILAAADLVISRAGANSIAEIAANQKPAILVPIDKSANDHQRMNAYELSKINACIVLDEKNLGEHLLMKTIDKVMMDEDLRKQLSENIKVFYHPEAAEKIVEGILNMTKE